MLNYGNLSDYEFENLCCDVLSRKLGIQLRVFAKGRDGGIDATDNKITHNIVVQAKYYMNSSYSSLKRALLNEVENINRLNPNQYYVCCAKQLTDNNIGEIYNMFSEYMQDRNNVIDLTIIDDFLHKPENIDVLKRNYKLWLDSTEVLNSIFNRNVLLDSEIFLGDIRERSKYFVKTHYYEEGIRVLDKKRILMILGLPGVGKTITTKMLALHYSLQNYDIIYTTNGNIADLKRTISESEDKKELIVLDDCLGQAYFEIKETNENEMISLIKYVSHHRNKKIIMNSRITIYNEAKEYSEDFSDFFDNEENSDDNEKVIFYMNMNRISSYEKGLIFYNHLFYNKVPSEYYCNIVKDKAYNGIILHNNYCPRIVEYVTKKHIYKNIQPDKYADYIIQCLDNPQEIWKKEYKDRIQQEDRILLTTLFSLTDTVVDSDVLKRAYNERMRNKNNVDVTNNYYENSLKRLNGSMIKLLTSNGRLLVSAYNPSVNDFLRKTIKDNQLEYEDIREYCTEYMQIAKLFPEYIRNIIVDGKTDKIHFSSDDEKYPVLLTYICRKDLFDENCKNIIYQYLKDLRQFKVKGQATYIEVLCTLLSKRMDKYYSIRKYLNYNGLVNLFERMNMYEFAEMLRWFKQYEIDINDNKIKSIMIEKINKSILDYCKNVIGENYYEEYDIKEIIDNSMEFNTVPHYDAYGDIYMEEECELNFDCAYQIVYSYIIEDIKKEILKEFEQIPAEFKDKLMLNPDEKDFDINLCSLENYLNAQFEMEPDYDDYYDDYRDNNYVNDELEYIFRDGAM